MDPQPADNLDRDLALGRQLDALKSKAIAAVNGDPLPADEAYHLKSGVAKRLESVKANPADGKKLLEFVFPNDADTFWQVVLERMDDGRDEIRVGMWHRGGGSKQIIDIDCGNPQTGGLPRTYSDIDATRAQFTAYCAEEHLIAKAKKYTRNMAIPPTRPLSGQDKPFIQVIENALEYGRQVTRAQMKQIIDMNQDYIKLDDILRRVDCQPPIN